MLHIEQGKDSATVHYKDKAYKLKTLAASVVVNCAGPGDANRFDTLTGKMLDNNWISVCPQSGGILVGKDS